ncbi:MAG: FHA domain-containing protein [Eubacterium sp.]|nr:FHA domain-containing protein [Eubacterium sp.]
MDFKYTRTASCSYMTLKDAGYTYEPYKMQMLLNNKIPGLLDMKVISENGISEYWYDITGLQPLDFLTEKGKIGWEQLCMIIRGICDVKLTLEKYLLDADDLIYDSKRFFRDRKTEKLLFCYVPGLKGQQTNGMLSLLETILERLDHNDPRVVRAGYELYESCAEGEAGVEKMLQCLQSQETRTSLPIIPETGHIYPERAENGPNLFTDPVKKPVMQVREEMAWPVSEESHKSKKPFTGRRKRKKEVQEDSDFWTEDDFAQMKEIGRWDKPPSPTVKQSPPVIRHVQEDHPTELFSEATGPGRIRLIYRGDGHEQDLKPQTFPFLIGKKEGNADGLIRARTVSRVHAKIYKEDSSFYLEDANSTNGTYVNGELLPCHTSYPLRQADRVIFGDQEYQVALLP